MQQLDQFCARLALQIHSSDWARPACLDPVNPAVRGVPSGVRIGMGRPLITEIADVDRTIRTEAQISCAEPRVVRIEQEASQRGLDGRSPRLNFPPRAGV